MQTTLKLVMGAVLCVGLATLNTQQASALDREFGSVNISNSQFTDVRWDRFGGPLDHVCFMPVNDAINCEHITITYMDGVRHQVFSGFIAEGQQTTITLPPPNDGRVREVSFACKAEKMDGARISLAATTESWPKGWESAYEPDHPARIITQARAE